MQTQNESQSYKAKILLVDDEQDVLDLYSDILLQAGYYVDTARNGEECLRLCEKTRYDLILLDLMMPVMDGIECLKKLRADEAKYGHPLIVVLTNVTMAINIKEAFDSGADGYLVKIAVSDHRLVDEVDGFLKGFKKKDSEPKTGGTEVAPSRTS
uniref:Response regulator n=1 Tax=candidate division CPR3 bacterium TaxID=2268181 RepID=A0A7C5URT2_UNCC3